MAKLNKKAAAELLPSQPTKMRIDPNRLVTTLITEPKWGKTTFGMSNPDAVLLAFEEGHKFHRGFKMIIDCWDARNYPNRIDGNGDKHMTFMQAIEALTLIKGRFSQVIIDTAEMAAKMCVDYHTNRAGKEHLQDMGDYGKGYDIGLNTPFRKAMLDLMKTGRGILLLCHTKVEIAKFTSGEKARKEMRLPGGVKYFIEAQSDIIMHGELGKRRDGMKQRDRILVCEGDMDTLAGNRTGSMLPNRYIVDRTGQWAQFKKFFTDPNAATVAEKVFRRHYKLA